MRTSTSRPSFTLGLFALGSLLLAPAELASAQAELTGTYVRYVTVGLDGTLISSTQVGESCETTFTCTTPGSICDFGVTPYECVRGRSMQYGEAATGTVSCDLYYPGTPVEGFTIEGTPAGGTATRASNAGDTTVDEVVTSSGPTATGRTIAWNGTATLGTATVDVDQIVELQLADRHVRVEITLTNAGTVGLTDVYYLRNGDPDHGQCEIGGDYVTLNDVRRQPPADTSALATAVGGDMASADRSLVVGIGAHDDRARVHNGGFANVDASGEWNMPGDREGTSVDEAVDIVFRVPSLAPSASVTFEFFYVWGRTVAEVETRFDDLSSSTAPCVGLMEGAACIDGARAGICRSTRCCTGCWNGTRCSGGSSASACGTGGATCATCSDADLCTTDSCVAGACSYPDAPMGTLCDDTLFCTETDTCDGAGTCGGAGNACDDGSACTDDLCDESADSCMSVAAVGCVIGGACVAEGAINGSYPCLICDPSRDTTDWSPRTVGTECGGMMACSMGMATPPRTCSAMGTCLAGPRTPCPTGACADATMCEAPCDDTTCGAGEYCAPSMRCEPRLSDGDPCTSATECGSGACADGVCCESACDGTCESCAIAFQEGECRALAAGMDPDAECGAGASCDGAGACTMPDAGPIATDDAGARDAGPPSGSDSSISIADAGTAPPSSGGCGCAVPVRDDRAPLAGAALLASLALVLARRRKRHG